MVVPTNDVIRRHRNELFSQVHDQIPGTWGQGRVICSSEARSDSNCLGKCGDDISREKTACNPSLCKELSAARHSPSALHCTTNRIWELNSGPPEFTAIWAQRVQGDTLNFKSKYYKRLQLGAAQGEGGGQPTLQSPPRCFVLPRPPA